MNLRSHFVRITWMALSIFALALVSAFAQSAATTFAGSWDAAFTLNKISIPFRLDIISNGGNFVGTLYNGNEKQTTTSTQLDGDKLTLNFEHYLTRIIVHLDHGNLTGEVDGRYEHSHPITSYPLTAAPHLEIAAATSNAPSIDGFWEIENLSPKGENAWRFIVQQKGDDVSASILRVDGDTGALVGRYRYGRFLLSHFDASRPLVAEITPQADGSLQIQLRGGYAPAQPLIAWRPEAARAKGLPEPDSFLTHNKVRDPEERFSFRFPDLNGKLVSSDDPQFKGKVYLAIVTGTWCPNCHDEAQYLVDLYAKYHSKGLEIVALDFEEPEQQKDLTRARAFIRKYNVTYPFVIAGAPDELHEKVPQAAKFDSWPVTLFVGKDGRVHRVHTGFAAAASGQFNKELQAEYTQEIDALLAENSERASNSSDYGNGK